MIFTYSAQLSPALSFSLSHTLTLLFSLCRRRLSLSLSPSSSFLSLSLSLSLHIAHLILFLHFSLVSVRQYARRLLSTLWSSRSSRGSVIPGRVSSLNGALPRPDYLTLVDQLVVNNSPGTRTNKSSAIVSRACRSICIVALSRTYHHAAGIGLDARKRSMLI